MKNLKLGVKLIGGFSLVAAITLVVGLIGWWGIEKLDSDLTEVGDVRLPSIEELMKAELIMEQIMLVHRTMMTEQINMEQRQRYLTTLNEHWQRLDQTWARFLELPATDEEVKLSKEFEQQLADWRRLDEQWRQHNQRFEALNILDPGAYVERLQRFRGDLYAVEVHVANLMITERTEQGKEPTTTDLGRWLADYSAQNPDLRRMATEARASHDRFYQAVTQIREAMQKGNRAAAQQLFTDVMQPAAEQTFAQFYRMIEVAEQVNTMRTDMTTMALGPMYSEAVEAMEVLENLIHINETIAKDAVSQGHANAVLAETVAIAGTIIGALLALALGVILTRSLTGPVGKSVEMIEALASGNLDLRLNFDRKDEIGRLAHAMDAFADNLRDEVLSAFENLADGNLTFEATGLIREPLSRANASLTELITQLQMSGEQIASGAGQVADSSQSLSQGATESASSLEEISASLNQLSSQTGTNAENANTANQLAGEARNAAQQGSQKMQEMVTAMGDINEAGQSISKIIKVIDEIAFQTNLLALNAAVEAARAGQHGKGFAVVAEEVRNLAARSAKAAAETSELIEGSVQKTANGTTIADQTAEALQSIVNGIGKVTDLVAEIAAASSEQAQGVSEINQGITQIDQVTQQNTASAEEGAAAAEELSGQAAQMREMLMRFTVKQEASSHSNVRAIPSPKAVTMNSGWGKSASEQPQKKIANKKPIALDDDEFGKY